MAATHTPDGIEPRDSQPQRMLNSKSYLRPSVVFRSLLFWEAEGAVSLPGPAQSGCPELAMAGAPGLHRRDRRREHRNTNVRRLPSLTCSATDCVLTS